MKTRIFFFIAFISVFMSARAAVADYDVVPRPQDVTAVPGEPFLLSSSTVVVCPEAEPGMQRNVEFLIDYVKETTGITLHRAERAKSNAVVLLIDPKVEGDEGYEISVTSRLVTVKACTARGAFYAVQTLRKSLPVEQTAEVQFPAVSIKDKPRFGYRGLMLDCGRHFFPLSFIKRYIDLIAMHNMNVFHWHLTEDQGWRIEIRKYPLLTQIGSMRAQTATGYNYYVYDGVPHGGFYTQEEAREIVRYAAERHITVVPEIDMPGHMLAALAAYPELSCTGGPFKVAEKWGIFPDVLCLGNKKVYEFCENVLAEIMEIFPSELIHLGGDEAPRVRWEECPKCQALAKEQQLTTDHLQSHFTNAIEKFVNSHGRRIVGWDEILEGPINKSAVIMSWRGIEPGVKAANLGHDVIMTPATHVYINQYQTETMGDGPLLAGGYIPLERVYELEPVPQEIEENSRSHIIGVQANLWTEMVAYPNVAEYQVLPRMAALAEVQWSEQPKDYAFFRQRLKHLTTLYDLYHYNYYRLP